MMNLGNARGYLKHAILPRSVRTREAPELQPNGVSRGKTVFLPPVTNTGLAAFTKVRWLESGNSSDAYGALHVAGRFCKKRRISRLAAYWTHGVIEPWAVRPPYSACVLGADPAAPCFVESADLAAKLGSAGYKRAEAIGAPFAYVPTLGLPRLAKSLLVFPPHFLVNQVADQQCPQYITALKPIRRHFDVVAACVYGGDVDRRNWIEDFRRADIPVIRGAHINDANSLVRMRALFEQFEYMTTPEWGSHIAYALACGVRVSLYGPDRIRKMPEEIWLKDIAWQRFPEVRRWIDSADYRELERAFTQPWRVTPQDGVQNIAIGEKLIGLPYCRSPDELATLFGWI